MTHLTEEHAEHTVSTEDAIADVLNYTHALTGMGGGAVMLLLIGFAGKAIYSKFREGLVTMDDIEGFAKEDDLEEAEEYIRRIDKKEQNTRGAVMKIAGHLEVDLPELSD